MCGDQKTPCRSWPPLSGMWVLEIEVRSSDLAASTLHWDWIFRILRWMFLGIVLLVFIPMFLVLLFWSLLPTLKAIWPLLP